MMPIYSAISRFSAVILLGLFISFSLIAKAQSQDNSFAYGSIDKGKLYSEFPDFNKRAKEYQVDSSAAVQLGAIKEPIHIKTYMATWCPDSKKHVPSMANLLEAADNSNISQQFIAVDYDKHAPDSSAVKHNVDYVPTFIFYHEGQEIGRIVETPAGSIESHTLAILKKAKLIK